MSPRRRGGGGAMTQSTPFNPDAIKNRTCLMLQENNLEMALNSAILSYAIGSKVPDVEYFQIPALVREKAPKAMNPVGLMDIMAKEGFDGFRLSVFNKDKEGNLAVTTKEGRQAGFGNPSKTH